MSFHFLKFYCLKPSLFKKWFGSNGGMDDNVVCLSFIFKSITYRSCDTLPLKIFMYI